jgi:hypothetical protein
MTDHQQYLIDAKGPNLTFLEWLKVIILSMIVSGGAGMFAAQIEREKRAAKAKGETE